MREAETYRISYGFFDVRTFIISEALRNWSSYVTRIEAPPLSADAIITTSAKPSPVECPTDPPFVCKFKVKIYNVVVLITILFSISFRQKPDPFG